MTEAELIAAFPMVFVELRRVDGVIVPMQHVNVRAGWYPLLHTLAATVAPYIKHPGDWYIDQIKEKFGGLRFYVTCWHDSDSEPGKAITAAIDAAEEASFHICETCGEPGALRNLSWVRTLCDACFEPHRKGVEDFEKSQAGKARAEMLLRSFGTPKQRANKWSRR